MADRDEKKVIKSDEEWRAQLDPNSYKICREADTEPAFTGKYWDLKEQGEYLCVACGELLFSSETKYDSGCGWPSFYQPEVDGRIDEKEDLSFGRVRTEVVCSRCDSHLGHVFPDGPQDKTGLRYCINSASLNFVKAKEG